MKKIFNYIFFSGGIVRDAALCLVTRASKWIYYFFLYFFLLRVTLVPLRHNCLFTHSQYLTTLWSRNSIKKSTKSRPIYFTKRYFAINCRFILILVLITSIKGRLRYYDSRGSVVFDTVIKHAAVTEVFT